MTRWTSDARSRKSKQALAVLADLRADLERRKIVKPTPKENIPTRDVQPWWAR